MIVPMKKVYILTQSKDAEGALHTLRDLGVVHVAHEQAPTSQNVEKLKADIALISKTIDILSQHSKESLPFHVEDWPKESREIISLQEKIEQLATQITAHQALINEWKPWGNFEPKDIQSLADQGIYIILSETTAEAFKKLPDDIVIENITSDGKKVRFLAGSHERDLPVDALKLPPMSLDQMQKLLDKDLEEFNQLNTQLKSLARGRISFEKILNQLQSDLQLFEAHAGMGGQEGLAYLKGFCPLPSLAALERIANQQKWVVHADNPTADDSVPTLIKNPKWVEIIKPMFDMLNIVPGYKEKDISPFFVIFFSIFFGMLVGDAGYGIIFLILTATAHKLAGAKLQDKSVIYLGYVLSVITIIWGFLTGTFFGTLLLGQNIKPILPWLTEPKNLQFLCFLLGVIHLSIAHVWRALTRGTFAGALGEIGWIMMLWGSFFLANMMLIGSALPDFVKYLYIFGGIFVIVDIIAQKNDIGVNMILFVFSVINTFGDIVSYIRLFAVGLAGVAVADAFNQMALSIGFGNIFTAIFATLILAFVHLFLNIALCVMGVLVHGVRLNVLEFSGHLGIEWSGTKYDPLRKH